MNESELFSQRAKIAARFKMNVKITRDDIFGSADTEYLPRNLPDDSATMFVGYVGSRYTPEVGLLLLGINPGGGGDAYISRTAEDRMFYPLLEAFAGAADENHLDSFEAINRAFPPIVMGWNLWRILLPTLVAAGATLDTVAYMNVVPYRTRGDKMPPVAARRCAWAQLVEPTLNVLRPRAIVTLGKKAWSVVDRLYSGSRPVFCVPRTIGDTYVSDAARAAHEDMRLQLMAGSYG